QTMFSAWNGEAIHLLFQVQQASPSPRLRRVLESSSQFLLTRLSTAEGGMWAYRQQGRAEGLGSLNDNAWGAMAFVAAFRLTGRADFREGLRRTLAYARAALLVPGLRVFRRWNVPHPQGLRRGEALSQEVPLGGNGLMALALLNAYEISGEREYDSLARNIIARLLTLEPELFDEDPADGGKLYLTQFVYYLNSLKRLKLLDI
ncbi:MAG: hypothetical protein V3S29_11815, partial [bacterium]